MNIDIMMPFYGRIDHFQAAVNSVLAQDDDRWRLVIVDDVYPDPAAGEWARSIDDPRVEYHRNAVNLGITGNFNHCVDLAEADRLVMMGSDDILLPGYVRRLHELVELHPDAAMIQPGVRVIDQDGRDVLPLADRVKGWCRPRGDQTIRLEGAELAHSLVRADWAYFPSVCWRTEDLRTHRFRAELSVVQDLALMLELIDEGGSLVLDQEIVFAYRRHQASLSSTSGPDGSKFVEERTVFAEAAVIARRHGWTAAVRAARWRLLSRLHALTALPAAIAQRDRRGIGSLLRHALGR